MEQQFKQNLENGIVNEVDLLINGKLWVRKRYKKEK